MIFKLNDILDFGPYKGETIKWVIINRLYYVELLQEGGFYFSRVCKNFIRERRLLLRKVTLK